MAYDLSIALRHLHGLAEADGDLGGEYWNQIIALLKEGAAARIQAEQRMFKARPSTLMEVFMAHDARWLDELEELAEARPQGADWTEVEKLMEATRFTYQRMVDAERTVEEVREWLDRVKSLGITRR